MPAGHLRASRVRSGRRSLAWRGHELTGEARLIVIAPREEIHQAVVALEFGADDCLAAPFTGEVTRIIDQEVGTSFSLSGRWFF